MFGNGSHTVACPHLVDTLTNCPSKNFEEVCQVQVCVQTLREFKLRHKNTTRQIRSHIFNFFAKQDLELQTSLNSGKGIIQSSLHAVLHVNSTPQTLQMRLWNVLVFTHLPLWHLKLSATEFSLKQMWRHHELLQEKSRQPLKELFSVRCHTQEHQYWSTTQH